MNRGFTYIISFLFAFLLAGTHFAFAQNNQTKSDPNAKKILDEASKKFKAFKTVKANFTIETESVTGEVESSEKGVLEMKGTKFKMVTGDQQIFSDGVTLWNYDTTLNEVTVSKLKEAAGVITPQQLFSNFYDKDFFYKLNGEKTINKKQVQEIELTPKDKSAPYYKVYLYIEKATQTVYRTKIFENGGNRLSYTIDKLNTTANLKDSIFIFDASKYPKIEIIDLQ